MKEPAAIVSFVVIALIAMAWVPVSRSMAWRRDYAEAEPLLQLVWPMAAEMKRFAEQNGRLPATLEEIAGFSKDYDFSRLRAYHFDFKSQGERIFHLRVNRRFSFEIDKGFRPKWALFTGVLDKPQDSNRRDTSDKTG